MSSGSWWWPPNWPAPKRSEHLQKDYETSTTTNTTRNLEEERLVGRIGVLTKRVEQLEIQFGGLYDSCSDLMGRIKSLENQMLWHEPVEKNDRIEAMGRAVRSERDANDAGPTAGLKIHMFGDEVELEEQLQNGKRKISQYTMKELKQRLKRK